jgi:hypothetical protein
MKGRREVSSHDGNLYIEHGEGAPQLVRMGNRPAALGAGWSSRFAYTGFAPFILLELQHDGGMLATWILNAVGQRIAGSLSELQPQDQAILVEVARSQIFGGIAAFLMSPDLPDELDPTFFSISPALLTDLQRLCGVIEAAPPEVIEIDRFEDLARTGEPGGDIVLTQAGLRDCLSVDLQERYLQACRTGVFTWPSPVDGAEVVEVRGMVLFTLLQAWRCVDRVHNLVFFVLAGGYKQETAAVWIPSADVLVTRPGHALRLFGVEAASLKQLLIDHLMAHGAPLLGFLSQPVRRFAHYFWPRGAAHIGHYLWNELSGLEIAVQQLEPVEYPLVYDLSGAEGAAFYGPLSLVFPELRGSILNSRTEIQFMLDAAYASGIQVMRFSGNRVSAEMRRRIKNVVASTSAAEEARMGVRGRPGPVVVFGLRVENRTVVGLGQFYSELARQLIKRFGGLTIIIDGHNSRNPADRDETFGSFLEHRATRKPVAVEHEVVAEIKAGVQGLPATVIDCVGMTMLDNLAWLVCANYCVAPWGAGLAKYRWVCNLPSYILISNYNQKSKNDVNIYHDPKFMESPAPLTFVDPSLVIDRPDADVLVEMDPIHVPFYVNYEVATNGVAAAVGDALAELADANGEWPRPMAHGAFDITDEVVVGADRQLFLASGGHDILSFVLGQKQPLQSSFANFSANIGGRAKSAAALGIPYAHVIFPDKQTVMNEAFGVANPVCLADIYARECSDVWGLITYPRDALRAAGAGAYLRTDTHLTHDGTLIVAQAVLTRLFGTACDEWVAMMKAAPRGQRKYAGDLGRKLDPVDEEDQVFIHHNPAIKTFSNNLNTGNNGSIISRIFPGAPRSERLVVLGDSFGADLALILSYLFSEVVFFRTPYWHPELVEMVRPDLVLTGNVERYLSYVASDADRPNFDMMNAMAYGDTPEKREFARIMSAQSGFGRPPYRRMLDELLFGAK